MAFRRYPVTLSLQFNFRSYATLCSSSINSRRAVWNSNSLCQAQRVHASNCSVQYQDEILNIKAKKRNIHEVSVQTSPKSLRKFILGREKRWEDIVERLTAVDNFEVRVKALCLREAIIALEYSGQPAEALKVFKRLEQMPIADTICNLKRTNVILQSAVTGDWEHALQSLSKSKNGLPISMKFFNVFIAVALQKSLDDAVQLFFRMKNAGLKPSTVNYISLIEACADHGEESMLRQIMNDMTQEDVASQRVIFSIALNACCKAGRWQLTLDLFSEMRNKKINPNLMQWTNLLNALGKGQQLHLALSKLAEMKACKLNPDVRTYTCLITAAAKSGDIKQAETFFKDMKMRSIRPNVFSYSAIISAYAAVGMLESAEKIFEGMLKNNILPNTYTYTSILRACVTAKDYEKAEKWMERMLDDGVPTDFLTWRTIFEPAHCDGLTTVVDRLYSKALASGGAIDPYRKQGHMRGCVAIMDLHRFTVGMALAAIRLELRKPDIGPVGIITGWGSKKFRSPVLMGAITNLLKEENITFRFGDHSRGMIIIPHKNKS